MAGQFRSAAWDPILISAQILTLQCVFYVSFGVWVFLMDFIAGTYRSLDQLLGYEVLQFKDYFGRLIMVSYVLNALTCALGLWYVVKRTKQCLDFTATIHLFHLVACWIYNGWFPSTLSWWLVNVVCIIITTVLGEFLCMRSELKAIPLSSYGPRADL